MLTQKQENFCLAYIETGNASEAYRRSYDINQMKPETIGRKAKELMDNGKIMAKIKELRAPAVEAMKLTLENHLMTLALLRDEAARNGVFGAAVSAEVARGKAAGLYIDRHEVAPAMTASTLFDELDRRRKALGIEVIDVTPKTAAGVM